MLMVEFFMNQLMIFFQATTIQMIDYIVHVQWLNQMGVSACDDLDFVIEL